MINITNKIFTHRTAIAQAIVKVSKQETIDAVKNKTVPKGDVLEASRVAGLFAIKRTSDMIPDCHPLPIEFAAVTHKIEGREIIIETEVGIKLLKKKGGKSQYNDTLSRTIKTAVVVCSDSISSGKKQDFAGKAIIEKLKKFNTTIDDYSIVTDEVKTIQEKVQSLYDSKIDLIILTGGTGLSKRDVTPEAIRPMLDREIPGIAEAARNYGQQQMPYAMLSRSIAGLKGDTLILALPGSTRGAKESMDALFPYLLHIFKVMENEPHII